MDVKTFAPGDEVVLISDDSITYIILSIYGSGYAICSYIDKKTNEPNELSIPLCALTKTNNSLGASNI